MKCIYCDEPLNDSDEHILQQGFGSTLSSKDIICKTCNDLFSNTLDSYCVAKYDLLYNQLGISGKPKKGSKDHPGKPVILNTIDGSKIVIDKNQRIAAQDSPSVKQIFDEDGILSGYEINGTDHNAIQSVIKSIKKGQKQGTTVEQPLPPKIISEKIGTLNSNVSFDERYFKGIKKSLLNFIAYHKRILLEDEGLKACLNDVYKCAKEIDNKSNTKIDEDVWYPFFSINKDITDKFISKYFVPAPICHHLIISCNKEDQSIIGVAILFNQFVHVYILSEVYLGDSETFFYSHSPLAKDEKTILDSANYPLLNKDNLIEIKRGSKELYEHLKNAYEQLIPEMNQVATSTLLLNVTENMFLPLPYPSEIIRQAEDEITDAVERFLILLTNIELRSILHNDSLLENEIHRILKDTSKKFYDSLVKQHGDVVLDDNIVGNLGLSVIKLFAEKLAPLFRLLLP